MHGEGRGSGGRGNAPFGTKGTRSQANAGDAPPPLFPHTPLVSLAPLSPMRKGQKQLAHAKRAKSGVQKSRGRFETCPYVASLRYTAPALWRDVVALRVVDPDTCANGHAFV